MQRPVGDRVELDVLGQGAGGRAAGVDHHDRVHEVAGAQHLDQRLLLDVDGEGLFLVAVDDGGDAAFATQAREAPLPARSRVSADSVSCSLIACLQNAGS